MPQLYPDGFADVGEDIVEVSPEAAFGISPASFMLTEEFDHIEERPRTRGGFVDVYRTTDKGQPEVVSAFEIMSMGNLENVHMVSGVIFCTSSALCERVAGWKWLRYENILLFVVVTSIPPQFSTVLL